MKAEENVYILRHKEYTVDLLHQIIDETRNKSYEDFSRNELLKEKIFSQLLEIGEASKEIVDITDDKDMEEHQRDIFQKLSLLRNVKYNQRSEYGTQQLWKVIKQDLTDMDKSLK